MPGARRIAQVAILLALCVSPGPVLPVTFSTQILPHHQTGTYGEEADTDILYVPLVLGLDSDRHALRLTIPYLSVRSDEAVIFSGGEVIGRPPSGETLAATNESGLGDIVIKEEYFFLMPRAGGGGPWVSGIARVKVPTADEDKGLGTGELDFGAGSGVTWPVGSRWFLLAEAGYIWRGDPEGVDLQNSPWLYGGVQWKLTEASSTSLTYDAQRSISRVRDDIRVVSVGYDYRFPGALSLRSAVSIGVSETAEDFGVTIGISVRQPVFEGRDQTR